MRKMIASILICALVLAGVNFATASIRAENASAELTRQMQALLPGSKTFTAEAYDGEDANIRAVYKAENGFVIQTCTAGYAGDIVMMVGVSSDGHVTGLVVREMRETFGLGAEALTDWQFLVQFLNTSGEAEVGVNVDALTGATVTSRAITRSINSAVAVVTGADASSGATSWGG